MKQKYYTLAEAALWIAFKDTEKTLDYVYKHWPLVQEAQNIILPNVLTTGRIHITSDQTNNIIFRDSYMLDFDRNMIHPPFGGVYELTTPQTNVKISVADMHREFPLVITGTKIETDYSAPYLEVATAVINRLGITNDNQPLKKNITDTIKEELINRNLPFSDRKVDALATMIRLPEVEKGGNRRVKNN